MFYLFCLKYSWDESKLIILKKLLNNEHLQSFYFRSKRINATSLSSIIHQIIPIGSSIHVFRTSGILWWTLVGKSITGEQAVDGILEK